MRAPVVMIGLIALTLAGCNSTGGPVTNPAAEAYCTSHGGKIVARTATWNTNANQSAQVPLATTLRLCEFQSGVGDQTTRISVDVNTLYATQPTLAAIAWFSDIKPTLPPTPSSNPATYNCSQGLGGTANFGPPNSVAGGGWVAADEPVYVVMQLCVFADMSAIDSFGLLYHEDGTVRGKDLTPLFRYQPGDKIPAVY